MQRSIVHILKSSLAVLGVGVNLILRWVVLVGVLVCMASITMVLFFALSYLKQMI